MPKKNKKSALMVRREIAPKNKIPAIDLGIRNAGKNISLYANIPCTVGLSYIRFQVDGTVKACCISKHTIGAVSNQHWLKVWHSLGYTAFRNKMLRIHLDKFHLSDPEWAFCQQCSHRETNMKNANLLFGKNSN